jgi:hypothetical protein
METADKVSHKITLKLRVQSYGTACDAALRTQRVARCSRVSVLSRSRRTNYSAHLDSTIPGNGCSDPEYSSSGRDARSDYIIADAERSNETELTHSILYDARERSKLKLISYGINHKLLVDVRKDRRRSATIICKQSNVHQQFRFTAIFERTAVNFINTGTNLTSGSPCENRSQRAIFISVRPYTAKVIKLGLSTELVKNV